MAAADILGWPISWPVVSGLNQAPAAATGARTIDDTSEKVAWVVRCPKDGTINAAGFLVGTVTQNPTNGLKVSLQDLDTSGLPDGTADQFRVVATGDISANTYVTTGLLTSDGSDTGTKRTVTAGQEIAVVVEFSSFVASDSLAINVNLNHFWGPFSNGKLPLNLHFVSAAWGSKQNTGPQNIALQYSDNTWEPIYGCLPVESTITTAYTAASTPDERGMKFVAPAPFRAVGVVWHGFQQNSSSAFTAHLYDSDDTELARATVTDPDSFIGLNTYGLCWLPFDAVADNVTLTTAATYRVTLKATSTGQINLNGLIPSSSTFNSAMPWGAGNVGTSRADAGSWTDATDGTQYAIGLLVDQTSDGVSAGGDTIIIKRNYD